VSWIATAAAIAAAGAALYAYRAGRAAALQAQAQAPRDRAVHGAPMRLTVIDGLVRTGSSDTPCQYAFLVSVLNDSGSTCTFTRMGLRVHYRTPAKFCCSIDVPFSASAEPGGTRTGEVTLRLPLLLEAGRSLTGWAHFGAADVVPADCTIDSYAVVMHGSGGESLVAPVPVVTFVNRSAPGGNSERL
jgi:hypothetical protein